MFRPEIQIVAGATQTISDENFLKETLNAVKKRRGLIHGKLRNGGVCAVGAWEAVLQKNNSEVQIVDGKVCNALVEVNDSVPMATPAERRKIVIGWIESQLKITQSP